MLVVQRTSSDLQLNPHVHAVFLVDDTRALADQRRPAVYQTRLRPYFANTGSEETIVSFSANA